MCVTRLWFSNEYNSVYCIRMICYHWGFYLGTWEVFIYSSVAHSCVVSCVASKRRSKRRTAASFPASFSSDAPSDAQPLLVGSGVLRLIPTEVFYGFLRVSI